ncbi:MAG: sigma-70 family RNA polymerase sigma factor [Hyphomonas sp.]|uniref:RNA polymerase sigma factor n=1 Tax=Hyphomonas sp. TaxID=87 RepID=UPI00352964FF
MTQGSDQDAQYLAAAEAFGPALQRLARATEAHPERRRDLLQDVHVALWQSFALFDGRCSLSTWVWRVAHNVAASHAGRERRHNAGQVGLEDVPHLADGRSLASAVEEADALDRLNAWIRRLKPPDRQVLTLYLEGLAAAEIAEIAGFSPGAVATRISRLKAQLAQEFREQSHD